MNLAWWNSLSRPAAASLVAAVGAVLILLAGAAWWLLHEEQAVLFADMRPQDAAVVTAELDKQKVPYRLGDGGASVLVDRSQVHALRLRLMGKELPLNGSVGFELFNQTDFGMTEFAQKINYQRALQGELTRTILAFPEVREARVHLALPERGLFRQGSAQPKAAITLGLRQGLSLRPEQVAGIQRLVAAAVPGLVAAEVTIVDQRGMALTRAAEGSPDTSSGRLDLKKETEAYLARKVDAVLERALGAGQALSSVDVILNMDQVRVTTEDVIAAPDAKGGLATGVLVRERESARDSGVPETRGDTRAQRGSSLQREVEYQAGRRVEHVVSQPGAIRRLQVVAVVREKLEEGQRQQLERVVAAAAGASLERGDTIVVQSLQLSPAISPAPVPELPQAAATPGSAAATFPTLWLLACALVFGCACVLGLRQHARRSQVAPALTSTQRQVVLERVQEWLEHPVELDVVKGERP
jgi:flagellar M-ring protein FliF